MLPWDRFLCALRIVSSCGAQAMRLRRCDDMGSVNRTHKRGHARSKYGAVSEDDAGFMVINMPRSPEQNWSVDNLSIESTHMQTPPLD
jgi:hypothetical protein